MSQTQPPEVDVRSGASRSFSRHYSRGIRIDSHKHLCAQLSYAVAGVLWIETEREVLVVPPQCAVWVPSGTLHSLRTMTEVEIRSLYFVERGMEHLNAGSKVFLVTELLKELILGIAEHEAKKSRGEAYLDTAYQLAVLELQRAQSFALHIPLPGASDQRINSLCRRVIDNPSIEITLEQHAAVTGASVRTISRLFAKELGVGFQVWRRMVQVAVALACLEERQAVSTIARSLGYSRSSFTRMFQRVSGMSLKRSRPNNGPDEVDR
jgi:AraC-like DNA-binding protein